MTDYVDWDLSDYLTATPYGEKRTTAEKITESDFYNEGYFVEHNSWDKTSREMEFFFRHAGAGNINIILLHGYQGTGKTTFLHWVLKKTSLFSGYGKMILDMAQIPDEEVGGNINPFFIFELYFRKQLNDFYENQPNKVLNFLELLAKYYGRLNVITFMPQNNATQKFWDKLMDLDEKIVIPMGQDHTNKDKRTIIKFFDELNYRDAFLLFLLLYFKLDDNDYETKYGFKKPTVERKQVVVFDNIDAVRIEQTNAQFPSSIARLYWEFSQIINTINESNPPILKFIFSIRDYNHSLLDTQNGDGIQIKEIDFKPPENTDKIIEKRIEIANKNEGKYSNASTVFDIFFNVAKSYDVYFPLFNYNLRKLAKNFVNISETSNVDDIVKFYEEEKKLKELLEKEKKLKKSQEKGKTDPIKNLYASYKNGLRGIFHALIIKALLETDNLKPLLLYAQGEEIVFEDLNRKGRTQINPARILLTIIHSLTEYTESEENVRNQLIGLGDVYSEFRKIFNEPNHVDVFFKKLTDLFLLHQKNWCHLITFRNKQVFNDTVFNEEKLLVKDGINKNNFEFLDKLNNIKVRINKSAHIYLTKVATHYEFFSMRAKNTEALFITAAKIVDGENNDECFNNMDNVWKIVRPCLISLINFLDKTTIENFENTPLCLDDGDRENGRKSSMVFRIIHMQLRYIDDFRKYVFYLSKTKKIDFKKMNERIVARQFRYIGILEKLCSVRKGCYDDRYKEFFDNYQKQKEIGCCNYVSLLNDSRKFQLDNP